MGELSGEPKDDLLAVARNVGWVRENADLVWRVASAAAAEIDRLRALVPEDKRLPAPIEQTSVVQ